MSNWDTRNTIITALGITPERAWVIQLIGIGLGILLIIIFFDDDLRNSFKHLGDIGEGDPRSDKEKRRILTCGLGLLFTMFSLFVAEALILLSSDYALNQLQRLNSYGRVSVLFPIHLLMAGATCLFVLWCITGLYLSADWLEKRGWKSDFISILLFGDRGTNPPKIGKK
jgi:hypothetical protein